MKGGALICFLLSFLLITAYSLAQESVGLTLSETEIRIYSGETYTVDLTVKNNLNRTDTFSVSIFPSFLNKVGVFPESAGSALKLESSSAATIKIYFSALPEAQETISPLVFRVYATSLTDPKITNNQTIQVSVLRKSPVFISDFKLEKTAFNPEETLTLTTVLINSGGVPSETYTLQTTLKKDSEIIKRFDETVSGIPVRSTKSISNSYTFGKYADPGAYSLTTVLKDKLGTTIDIKSADIKVNKVYKLPTEYTEKTQTVGFLSVLTIIKVKNEGNVPTPSFYITESIPLMAKDLFDPETEPATQSRIDNRIVYSWLITSLAPGQEVTIKYSFRLWHVWLWLLAICAVVYFAFKYVFQPSIVKTHRHFGPLTRGKEIVITLEVKNRSINEVKDVVVKDIVPPIAEVVQKFDTLRPTLKRTDVGTELAWKFDSLRPREERVLTYRIKPMVDIIGTLRLPHATIKYSDKKKQKKSAKSRVIVIKSESE